VLTRPGGHGAHTALSIVKEKRPAGHGVQAVEPLAGAKVPTGQAKHRSEPGSEYRPTGQLAQLVPQAEMYVPALCVRSPQRTDTQTQGSG
jgi:hypothetical protein